MRWKAGQEHLLGIRRRGRRLLSGLRRRRPRRRTRNGRSAGRGTREGKDANLVRGNPIAAGPIRDLSRGVDPPLARQRLKLARGNGALDLPVFLLIPIACHRYPLTAGFGRSRPTPIRPLNGHVATHPVSRDSTGDHSGYPGFWCGLQMIGEYRYDLRAVAFELSQTPRCDVWSLSPGVSRRLSGRPFSSRRFFGVRRLTDRFSSPRREAAATGDQTWK